MADNVTLDAGAGGSTIATDDVGGIQYQRVKLDIGGDGAASPVTTSNPLPVSDAGGSITVDASSLPLPTGASTAAKQPALGTAGSASSDVITVQGVASMTPIQVSDGGGSLTVDGTVAATQSGNWSARMQDGSGNALTSKAPGSERALSVAIVDGSGAQVTSFGGSGGTSATDDAAFTAASGSGTPMMGFATADSVDSGDVGVLAMTTARELKVSVTSGGITAATHDAAAQADGVQMMAAGSSSAPSAVSANGDAVRLWATTSGALNIADGAGSITVDNAGTFAVQAGQAAHDAAISGSPVRLAGRALTSDYSAVSAGDTADLITTLLGKLVVIPYSNPANSWSYAAGSGGITNTTAATIAAAAGAGVRNYCSALQVINGHASTSTEVLVRDGAGGTVLWRGFAQAGGGGAAFKFEPPLRGTANTLMEVVPVTTGTATYFNAQGFTAAE